MSEIQAYIIKGFTLVEYDGYEEYFPVVNLDGTPNNGLHREKLSRLKDRIIKNMNQMTTGRLWVNCKLDLKWV